MIIYMQLLRSRMTKLINWNLELPSWNGTSPYLKIAWLIMSSVTEGCLLEVMAFLPWLIEKKKRLRCVWKSKNVLEKFEDEVPDTVLDMTHRIGKQRIVNWRNVH